MLRNTLILPETEAVLAARLLQDAIDTLDIVLLLVLGSDAQSLQAVEWADRLADRTLLADGRNPRKVVWIRDATAAEVRAILDGVLGPGRTPRAAILDFHDNVRGELAFGKPFDPLTLELLFLAGTANPVGGGT